MSALPGTAFFTEAEFLSRSAHELARRSRRGVPIYFLMSLLVIFGTPVFSDFPRWTGLLTLGLGVITFYRMHFANGFEDRYRAAGERAVRQFIALMAGQSLLWVLVVITIIVRYGVAEEAALAMLITAGFSAGGTHTLAVRRRAALIYLATAHTPIFLAVLLAGGPGAGLFLTAIAVFTVFLYVEGGRINRAYVDNLRNQLNLEVARRNADAANRAKGQFLANMSHELRTLMNGVLGMNNLLMETPLSGRQYGYAKTIKNSANSLLRILNDILDYSKIEAGALELDEADFDIRKLLNELTNLVAWSASEKGIEYISAIDPAIPSTLRGDAVRLRQVFLNLIGNAIKFTEHGHVSVWVEPGEPVANKVSLRIRVTDTGIGIPAGKLDKLFQPYEQLDPATTHAFGGTGLGLTICKHLVEQMGGEIRVESEENAGSMFEVSLALQAASDERAAPAAINEADFEAAPVVVADDNPASRRWLRILLESAGCRPQAVGDLEQLARVIEEAAAADRPFRAAYVDLRLVGDTLADFNRWRENQPWAGQQPLVCMVPLGTMPAGETSEILILTKPIKAAAFRESLNHALLEPIAAQPASAPAVRRESRQLGGEFRILVAEDNKLSEKVTMGILENAGIHAEVVPNGAEALRALAQANYDLVLMDCIMPELDGFDATRKIRSGESGVRDPNVKIIALTALAVEGDREKCLAAGMDDYMTKPVNALTLIGMLERYLGGPVAVEVSTPSATQEQELDDDVFERAGIQAHLKWGRGQLHTIIRHFLKDAPRQVADLERAIDRGDAETVRLVAHQIRGSAGILAAAELEARASALEDAATSGNLEQAEAMNHELSRELEKLVQQLGSSDIAPIEPARPQ